MKVVSYLLLVGVATLLAGCATTRLQTFTISGGETITLPVAAGGAIASENADVKIEVTGFMLDTAAKAIVYTFGFTEKNRAAPRSVTVEDVTGPTAQTLLVDSSPRLSAQSYWKGTTEPRKPGDPALRWVDEPGDTTKVFRFTIVTARNRTVVIHQASVWSAAAKPLIRQALASN